ncbi:PorP/SprF family type IX secretion system membrane protein [Ferruginibacter sp. SUN106]|uniref:PorP/SprF family type IX secretion system membrane protein n=1 Tax=Ferruginibacter sp. SUN106 TaxID=2978348 RepID=UPI003D367606
MKKIILIAAGCICSVIAFAQAKPFYTQYILNNYILNPAVAGIENYADIKLSSRNQWTGINGAPVTTYFSFHAPIGKEDLRTSATSFQVPGENPRGKRLWEEYTPPDPHHGIGIVAMNDKAGYINRWSITGTYAYHKPLSVRTTLSAGFNIGVNSVNLDRSKIEWANLDPNDPAIGISTGELKKIKPEIGAGLWLYSAQYFVGISVLNIIPGKAKFVTNDKYGVSYTPNYFATAGYRFSLTDDVMMMPSVMFQYWQPQLAGLHANVKFQYQDLVWVGGGYRFSDLISGYSALAGINVSNTFNVSYSYEVATSSRLRSYTNNTHEIMLGFIIGNKYSQKCPRCY